MPKLIKKYVILRESSTEESKLYDGVIPWHYFTLLYFRFRFFTL